MSNQLANALRSLLLAYNAATYSDEKVGEDDNERNARQALEAFDARTFAADCHALADRAQDVVRSNPGLRPNETHLLRMLVAAGHAVGDNADCAPDLYAEPCAPSPIAPPAMLPLEAACLDLAERLERIRKMNNEPYGRALALGVAERELRSLARVWAVKS